MTTQSGNPVHSHYSTNGGERVLSRRQILWILRGRLQGTLRKRPERGFPLKKALWPQAGAAQDVNVERRPFL